MGAPESVSVDYGLMKDEVNLLLVAVFVPEAHQRVEWIGITETEEERVWRQRMVWLGEDIGVTVSETHQVLNSIRSKPSEKDPFMLFLKIFSLLFH